MKGTVIPIVIGVLGMVPKGLKKGLEIGGRIETIQTTALLKSARILGRVLETWGDLQTLRLQWKTTNLPWWEKLARNKIIIDSSLFSLCLWILYWFSFSFLFVLIFLYFLVFCGVFFFFPGSRCLFHQFVFYISKVWNSSLGVIILNPLGTKFWWWFVHNIIMFLCDLFFFCAFFVWIYFYINSFMLCFVRSEKELNII